MKTLIYDSVEIFIHRCKNTYAVCLLHCYEVQPTLYDDDIEKRYRCDYDKKSSFEISRLEDFDGNLSYGFLDLHDTDGIYDPISEERALEILKDECKKQGVAV